MIVEIAIGVVSLIIMLGLLIGYIGERRELKLMTNRYIKASLESYVFKKNLDKIAEENVTLRFSDNQEFVKFLSDSRDMAFEYIEDVQAKIVTLKDSMKAGDPVIVNESINALIDMLPKEDIPNN
jgi:hypothetical protein